MQPNVKHQAMVILQNQIKATTFAAIYNARVALPKDKCYSFITNSNRSVLTKFIQLKFRTLVIVQRLKEGFDHPNISVVGIARHVSSPVMFTQFVGRAVRKPRDDGVGAVVITHSYFNQSRNFERLTSLRRDDENDAVDDQEEKVDDE
jgi:superfamily II DNA or RNA helicase